MKKTLIEAIRAHANGHIAKHKANIEVYLNNPVGVGEHADIIETIENELAMIGKYQEQLDILNTHFTEIDYSKLKSDNNLSHT